MKKFLIVFSLSISACGLLDSPAKKACTKLVSLCEDESADAAKCASEIEAFDQKNKTNSAQKFSDCMAPVTTCAEAVGCAAGAGASSFIDLGGQFLKGLNKGLGK